MTETEPITWTNRINWAYYFCLISLLLCLPLSLSHTTHTLFLRVSDTWLKISFYPPPPPPASSFIAKFYGCSSILYTWFFKLLRLNRWNLAAETLQFIFAVWYLFMNEFYSQMNSTHTNWHTILEREEPNRQNPLIKDHQRWPHNFFLMLALLRRAYLLHQYLNKALQPDPIKGSCTLLCPGSWCRISTIFQSANCIETMESESMQLIQIWVRKRLSPLPGFEPQPPCYQADLPPIKLSRLGWPHNFVIYHAVSMPLKWGYTRGPLDGFTSRGKSPLKTTNKWNVTQCIFEGGEDISLQDILLPPWNLCSVCLVYYCLLALLT